MQIDVPAYFCIFLSSQLIILNFWQPDIKRQRHGMIVKMELLDNLLAKNQTVILYREI
jgi:hypothetical protein